METSASHQIIYEHPVNERIRTFLRLELLFQQYEYFLPQQSVWASRATIKTFLDIVSIFGRTDLKSEILKELERHSLTLTRIRSNPGVDLQRLGSILDELDGITHRLHRQGGQIGLELRKNEFFKTIMNRTSIPGGDCAFDLPMFHFWLQLPHARRLQDLHRWMSGIEAARDAITLLLALIRGSSTASPETASNGFFQQSLESEVPTQMIRVAVDRNLPIFAEISGGKHRFTVRFLEPSEGERPSQTEQDVNFALTRCII